MDVYCFLAPGSVNDAPESYLNLRPKRLVTTVNFPSVFPHERLSTISGRTGSSLTY